MSLNIKNEHVHDLVRQAAERTGLSQTSVVERAIEQLLASLDDDKEARRRSVDAILAEIRVQMRKPGPPLLTDDDLYDENGLPR
ncbi:type II toxin-antitoxin system VapB family antitoxin [Microlunatus sagamiharensis]|uniref:type II toxin-antitoxin system VapB family antitoxin n=1 Tax=Microlunatus sagamiharensis TaxID=546874 RepID=UPI0012FD1FDE|nr:type II toxin-antitoxin system VapB family antitoxin [Microlunatus sagamiharensis]